MFYFCPVSWGIFRGLQVWSPEESSQKPGKTLKNIKAVLERCGSAIDKIAKCTVYLVDPSDKPIFDDAYRTFFNTNFPARTTVIVKSLALNARVEIECIAAVGK